MTTQSEVVLLAWGLLAVACIWARVLDALDARRRRRRRGTIYVCSTEEAFADVLGLRDYRPPTRREARGLFRAARGFRR